VSTLLLVVGLVSGGSSPLTRLRFVRPSPSGEATGRGRALSLPLGKRIWGDLHTLGYFAADLCVGNPPRTFTVIVDTGSSLTALPCASCTHCGGHAFGARLNESASSTAVPLRCSSSQACSPCGTSEEHGPGGTSDRCPIACSGGACTYHMRFSEGSTIVGHLVEEEVRFATPNGFVPVRATLGCQSYESGLFYSQQADGITGLAFQRPFPDNPFSRLVRSVGAPRTFSLCLSSEVGVLLLGGAVPPTLKPSWIYTISPTEYEVEALAFLVDGVEAHGDYSRTRIDSGTTFLYLPAGAYLAARGAFVSRCPWGNCSQRSSRGPYSDDVCYAMGPHELPSFVNMTVVFARYRLQLRPRQYMYEAGRGLWCFGVFETKHNGVVVGAAAMRGHELLFDLSTGAARVAFVPADCEAVYAGNGSSVLVGGYGLSGCAHMPARGGETAAGPGSRTQRI